jgi:trk system potassium uptake protein TrkA
MRAAFIGANGMAVATARLLLERNHEVVIIERDEERIDELGDVLDCAFIHGNGTKPAILKEVDPSQTDVLFCLTRSDETNIIASLVGRSLGFGRVITRIEDTEFEHVCIELGLESTIVPTQTIARHLTAMFSGQDVLGLSALVGEEARLFGFVARAKDAGPVADLDLPRQARVMYLTRDGQFHLADSGTHIRAGDEVVVVTHRRELDKLMKRWSSSHQRAQMGQEGD